MQISAAPRDNNRGGLLGGPGGFGFRFGFSLRLGFGFGSGFGLETGQAADIVWPRHEPAGATSQPHAPARPQGDSHWSVAAS